MTKLGIVTGLAFEAKIARAPRHPDIEVLCLGPGPDNAKAAAETLVEGGATMLMSFGVAGALDPALKAGDIVVADCVLARHGDVFSCDPALTGQLHEHQTAIAGALLGANQAIDTIEKKSAAFADTGAIAVDMESHAVARVAQQADVRLTVSRAIIDPAHQQLPSAVLAGAKPEGGLNIFGLCVGLLQHPSQIADVLRLSRQNSAARKALRDFALLGFPQLFLG